LDNQSRLSLFRGLAIFSVGLALVVILLGAYTRLSDAGLGCPDWPGCYGSIGAPNTDNSIAAANQAFPERPVETAKAWKEMVHRYFAGTLGLVILWMAIIALRNKSYQLQPVKLPLVLVLSVIFQAALGMWTVTLKVMPIIVLAHLLGGFLTLALLWLVVIRTRNWHLSTPLGSGWFFFGVLGLMLLIAQIMLGGWTSSNYAALACPDFPACQSQWWPPMDFSEGFVLWRGTGIDYEFGVLDSAARTAIHMTHRIGAIVVATYLLIFSFVVLSKVNTGAVRRTAWMVFILVIAQVMLGISNVLFALPLPVAVIHNGTAAILLLSVITLIYLLQIKQKIRYQQS
jgi:cytochrome c oxidase assembly protein subunit 15